MVDLSTIFAIFLIAMVDPDDLTEWLTSFFLSTHMATDQRGLIALTLRKWTETRFIPEYLMKVKV